MRLGPATPDAPDLDHCAGNLTTTAVLDAYL